MTEKHQLLQSYKQASSYFHESVEVKRSIPLISQTYSQEIQTALKMCHIEESAEVSHDVVIKGTQYKRGQYVPLSKYEDGLVFGEIKLIILNPCTQVYFLVKEFRSQLSREMHVYTVVLNSTPSFHCVDSTHLLDYYPLNAYRRGSSLLIALRHSVNA